jgi:hypothetical protein
MNMSALLQMTDHWPEVLVGLSFLRDVLVPRRPVGEVTLLDFWRIAKAGALVPSFLIYRGKDPLGDGQIPGFVAAMYKASLGLFDTAQTMVLNGILTGENRKDTGADPNAMMDYADRQQILIGPHEVCAGPASMIKEAMRAVTDGHQGPSRLEALLPDTDRFSLYVGQEQILYLTNYIFPIISYFTLSSLFRAARAAVGTPGAGSLPLELSRDLLQVETGYPKECRSLDGMDQVVRRLFVSSLYDLLTTIDRQGRARDLFRRAASPDGEQRKQLSNALLDFTQLALGASPRGVNPAALNVIMDGLAGYLTIERIRLQTHAEIQSRGNLALCRDCTLSRLDSSDITGTFGVTVRDVVAEFLGIEICNTSTETIVTAGKHQRVVV